MKLKDWQEGPIVSAVAYYIKHTVSYEKNIPNDTNPDHSELATLARGNLYDVLCLFFETGNPDPIIQENLDNEIWTSPADVINYIEATY